MDRQRVLLVIPAYNEAESIERTVNQIIADYPQFDYIIVNDGSRDETADICRANGYRFLDLPMNLGLAGAFQAGMKYAQAKGYDCAVQFDADGQHRPEYIADLIDTLSECDIAIGSRFVTEKKPRSLRMFGNNIISVMLRLTCGKTINDPTSGMRAFNKRMINELATGPNLSPEPDTLAYLMRKKKARVKETQVYMQNRMAGESYFNARSSAVYMIRMACSVLFIQFFR